MIRPALATCLLLSSTAPVLAWSAPDCTRLEQGQPLCAITEWYALGGQAGRVKILLADGDLYLLLQHAAWHRPGEITTVLAHVDEQPPIQRKALARDDGVLIRLLEGDLPALANGQSLTITMPQAAITYPLTGSLKALDALLASYAAFARGSRAPAAAEVHG
jgi:hypothetical protein